MIEDEDSNTLDSMDTLMMVCFTIWTNILRSAVANFKFHCLLSPGIWAMALAIQTVAQRVKLKYKEKTVQDFRYRDKEWEQLFLDALGNVTFEGVTVS